VKAPFERRRTRLEPHVILLDAYRDCLDQEGLRERARAATPSLAPCSSRSYKFPFAIVAWHTSAVGVDLERLGTFPRSRFSSIACPEERAADADGEQFDVTDLWSGKEAAAKAMGDARRYDPRIMLSPVLWPDGRAGRWRARRVAVPQGHIAWMCWQA